MAEPTDPRCLRLACALGALALAGLASSLFLLRELAQARAGTVFFGEEALRDPDVRREVVRKLSEANLHPFDSHPDAEVARVLVPDSQRGDFRTNAIGMRGPPFALEKPPGVVRIVMLGDSYVFGVNVAEEDRLSDVLARELGARAAQPARIECLNLAVNSWNLVAECAFLRRQVDALRPDLVIQVTYPNDLDDVTGVRGFGAEARFAPRWPAHGDGLVFERHAQSYLGVATSNLLPLALDHEGRTRFAEALEALTRLRTALGALPERAPHLLVVHWKAFAPAFHARLGAQLAPQTLLYLPEEYGSDRSLWITPADPHWNAAGHARVARLLYGVIRARGLLPGVSLAPWTEADRAAVEEPPRGLAAALEGHERLDRSVPRPLAALDFPEVDLGEARQIYGGIDRDGLVSPYASCALWRPPGARALRLTGAGLPDQALAGARVRVHLEELELVTLEIRPGTSLALELLLPDTLQEREWLNLRFTADDYVYRGSDLRHCVVFRLQRAALE